MINWCHVPLSFNQMGCQTWWLVPWFVHLLLKAELRASVFEAIEEEDRAIEKEDGLPPALLGSCNDRAKQLHASPSGYFAIKYEFL